MKKLAATISSLIAALTSAFAWDSQTEDAFRTALAEGQRLLDQARYVEAERSLLQAMEIAQPFGPAEARIVAALNALGALYFDQSRLGDAEAAARHAARICEKGTDCGSYHPVVLGNLAGIYQVQGRHAEAAALYRRALAVQESGGGKSRPEYGRLLVNYANAIAALGRISEAEKLSRRAIENLERLEGEERALAFAYSGLGSILGEMKRFSEAERACLQAISYGQRARGLDHPWLAGPRLRLGMVYRATGRLAEAESQLRDSLKIARKGGSTLRVGMALSEMALLFAMRSQYDEAERCFRESIDIARATLGPDHPDVIFRLREYAALLRRMKRKQEAKQIEKEAKVALANRGNGDMSNHTVDVQALRSSGRNP